MDTIVSTSTKDHERLERVRDRFSQVTKEREEKEPQRKGHRPEGLARQPFTPPGEEGSISSSGSALLPALPLAPPPLAKQFGIGDQNDRGDRGAT